jgi:hypothetical protein
VQRTQAAKKKRGMLRSIPRRRRVNRERVTE